ncbi:hypothetical protein [Sphingopyxis sp.]|uniref:hypothetical protein n=1 Tax=Sphingopyxis sp. TaxID=1908224 RepID=UPI0035B0DEA6
MARSTSAPRLPIGRRSGEFAAWARNVTGKACIVDALDTTGYGFVPRYYGEHATYGVELSFHF